MTSSIVLSDNGVSSGSAGIKTAGGNDGTLLLQTTTSGGSATTAIAIDTSQNVGVGVTPSGWTGGPATQFKYGGSVWANNDSSFHISENAYFNGSWNYISGSSAQATNYYQVNGTHAWRYAAAGTGALTWTTAMTLDASGRLQVAPSTGTGMVAVGDTAGGGTYNCGMYRGAAASVGSGDYLNVGGYSGIVFTTGSAALGSQTERARIDSSGNLLVGTTSQILSAKNCTQSSGNAGSFQTTASAGNNCALAVARNGNDGRAIEFYQSSSTFVGSVSVTSTATAYNTSSDYRLKENITPLTGALGTVAQLKPVTYTWKSNGEATQGFIAHELQAVLPEAVTGEKDATRIEQYEISPAIPATFDEENNELTPAIEAVMGEREVPVYQGIDTSFLVATLTAAIQEQQAIIQTLTERITALERAKA